MDSLAKPAAPSPPDAFTPWAQLPDEADLDYEHFWYWLNLRPRPPSIDPALFVRHNWGDRAQAYDRWQRIQGLSPREIGANAFRMWAETTLNETIKIHENSLTLRAPQLDPKVIQSFMEMITDPARNQAQKQTHDLSKLSPERAALLLEILEEIETKD